MTKKFERKIFVEGGADTRKYRYVLRCYADRMEIQRLPIEYLDTTMAYTGWETVKVYEERV